MKIPGQFYRNGWKHDHEMRKSPVLDVFFSEGEAWRELDGVSSQGKDGFQDLSGDMPNEIGGFWTHRHIWMVLWYM